MRTLVANFFGGPGTGKSGVAASVYGRLRKFGYPCELVREAAQDAIWREDKHLLNNQVLITALQLDRVLALDGKVRVVVSDSPIITGLIFPTPLGCSPSWRRGVIDQFNEFWNLNFYLVRDPNAEFEQDGRRENEEEAQAKDAELLALLEEFGVPYTPVQVSRDVDLEVELVPIILREAGL